tara:strand:- start:9 stop:152 length:144 start_codon:yes stop_codon:yes gene_type:complete
MKGLDRIMNPPLYSTKIGLQDAVLQLIGSSAEEWRVLDVETGGTSKI